MSRKKIGIITLHGYKNYGNRLQNFALIRVLEKMGYEVETVVIKNTSTKKMIKNFVRHVIEMGKNLTSILRNNNSNEIKKVYETQRTESFKSFSKKYLKEKFYTIINNNENSNLKKYDFFITGSDQVWNALDLSNLNKYFLSFTEPKKRIAYAPSIGRDSLPEGYHSIFKNHLEKMHAISIREEAGAKIIKDLVEVDVPVVVDPTMLLDRDEWLSIAQQASNRPNGPYLLTYFLGGPSTETRLKLNKLAKENNMKIINLGDSTDKETYITGPSEFIDYINNASAFFTDSFHGVVFSIILKTPFVVYERISNGVSMYSRIDTLLELFDMRHREANGFIGDYFSMDFSGSQRVLAQEFDKSINYLSSALRIEE